MIEGRARGSGGGVGGPHESFNRKIILRKDLYKQIVFEKLLRRIYSSKMLSLNFNFV
jgi:hypothetical protein